MAQAAIRGIHIGSESVSVVIHCWDLPSSFDQMFTVELSLNVVNQYGLDGMVPRAYRLLRLQFEQVQKVLERLGPDENGSEQAPRP